MDTAVNTSVCPPSSCPPNDSLLSSPARPPLLTVNVSTDSEATGRSLSDYEAEETSSLDRITRTISAPVVPMTPDSKPLPPSADERSMNDYTVVRDDDETLKHVPLQRSNTLSAVDDSKQGFFRLPGWKRSLSSVVRLRASTTATLPSQSFSEESGPGITWDVHITGALTRYDPKPYWSYQLRVRRDMDEGYHISKRYGQFEELHKKLKRSYNFDAILPAKRLLGNMDVEFIQARKVELQHYLDRLLSNRSIAGSKVIDEFFRSQIESPNVNRRMTPSEATRKQRTTDLEQDESSAPPSPVSQPLSTPMSPVSNPKPPLASIGPSSVQEPLSPAPAEETAPPPTPAPRTQHNAEPLFDFVDELFELNKGWGVRMGTLGFLRGVSRLTLNEVVFGWMAKQVQGAITPAELVSWIDWGRDKMWPNGQLYVAQPEPSPEELAQYRHDAKACLRDCVPGTLYTLIGERQVNRSIHKLFTLFQIEPLTRHLAFTCLDNLLLQLFPDQKTQIRQCK